MQSKIGWTKIYIWQNHNGVLHDAEYSYFGLKKAAANDRDAKVT